MIVFRWSLLLGVLVMLVSCLPPDRLSEDAFGAKKYGLPPVIHPGEYKVLELTPGTDSWAYMPVITSNLYTLTQIGFLDVSVSVYHQDKTTPIVLNVDPKDQPGFWTDLEENVFLKVTHGPIEGQVRYSLTCDPLVEKVLQPGVWLSDSVSDGQTRRYGVPAVAGTTYGISLSNGYSTEGKKTYWGYVQVYSNNDSWYLDITDYTVLAPLPVVAPQDGLLVLEVGNGYTGTFAVRYQILP